MTSHQIPINKNNNREGDKGEKGEEEQEEGIINTLSSLFSSSHSVATSLSATPLTDWGGLKVVHCVRESQNVCSTTEGGRPMKRRGSDQKQTTQRVNEEEDLVRPP